MGQAVLLACCSSCRQRLWMVWPHASTAVGRVLSNRNSKHTCGATPHAAPVNLIRTYASGPHIQVTLSCQVADIQDKQHQQPESTTTLKPETRQQCPYASSDACKNHASSHGA